MYGWVVTPNIDETSTGAVTTVAATRARANLSFVARVVTAVVAGLWCIGGRWGGFVAALHPRLRGQYPCYSNSKSNSKCCSFGTMSYFALYKDPALSEQQ